MDEPTPANSTELSTPTERPSAVRNRIRQLTTPWWRLLWLIGGIAWAVVFNVIYVTNGGTQEWLGIASVIPIAALLVDLLRVERLERTAANKSKTKLGR